MNVNFASIKCDLELQSMAQQVAHLEKVIADNLFQWECCARGGNKTENGGCNIQVVENEILNLQKTDRILIWTAIAGIIFLIMWKLKNWCSPPQQPSKMTAIKRQSRMNYDNRKENCGLNYSVSTSAASSASNTSTSGTDICNANQDQETKSISIGEIEELKNLPNFMSNPLAALTGVGASNRDVAKVLKHLSNPSPIEKKIDFPVLDHSRNELVEDAITIENDLGTQIQDFN